MDFDGSLGSLAEERVLGQTDEGAKYGHQRWMVYRVGHPCCACDEGVERDTFGIEVRETSEQIESLGAFVFEVAQLVNDNRGNRILLLNREVIFPLESLSKKECDERLGGNRWCNIDAYICLGRFIEQSEHAV